MQVYVTGDTHGDFTRLYKKEFLKHVSPTADDCLIICGDFGGVWSGAPRDDEKLDRLDALPFFTLFVDGNHENFDELNAFPEEEWQGGRVHRIRSRVLHLMRGQVFEIAGSSFFTMGGARSTDVWDGILDPEEPDFEQRFWELSRRRAVFRVKHLSWWEEELPSAEEYAEARRALERVGHQVDFILTHCAPDSIQDALSGGRDPRDALTGFLEEVKNTTCFRHWFFGHYHADGRIEQRYYLLYHKIVRII